MGPQYFRETSQMYKLSLTTGHHTELVEGHQENLLNQAVQLLDLLHHNFIAQVGNDLFRFSLDLCRLKHNLHGHILPCRQFLVAFRHL